MARATAILIWEFCKKCNMPIGIYGDTADLNELGKEDLISVIGEYSRKGINFFVAAIGNDRDVIKDIYGNNKFLDISNINTLSNRLSMILKNLV